MEYSEKLEKCKGTIKSLETATLFYKQQVEVLTAGAGLAQLAGQIDDKELLQKYAVQCDQLEDLLKKQERMSAQLRRKDWEIENYQRKLDSAFEAGIPMALAIARPSSGNSPPDMKGWFFISIVSIFILTSPGVVGNDGYQPGPSSSGGGETVLDLSTKKKPEDTNNNIKTEQGRVEEAGLRSRKYSELSDCSAASSVPGGLQETPETSAATASSPGRGETTNSSNKRANPSPPEGPEPKKPASGILEED